ncbi:META domain-containing protein [Hymenobacter arizonensis]|uniref:Heat shock protein HslJ n=1 Tax=Hymenobacter arizonensis TaxID=1227077 RepID=A0A1I5UJ08_HYMAR|nr:META domain-containing protein [Hymenobacter arizonensis]SFP95281.1 Heat shock protein HslJ [Hymenobacter arizonensis]
MLTKILLLNTALLAAACQATNPTANSAAQPSADPASPAAEPPGGGSEKLFAHRWALTEAAGQPVAPTGDASEAHLLFFPPSRVTGSTGCNRLTGSFELTGGGQVKFSPLGTTRMMCPEPAAAGETRFVQAMATVKSYYVTDEALELRDGTTVVARFRATPASPEK